MSRYRSMTSQARVMPAPPMSGAGGFLFWVLVWMVVIVVLAMTAPLMAAAPSFPGLGDPGKPVKLWIHVGHTEAEKANQPARIIGPDDRLQLVVSAAYQSGQVRDHSRSVRYGVTPGHIIRIEPGGRVVPLADGQATVTVEGPESLKASVVIHVEQFANPPAVNFANEVVPIFTKTGCNSGGCHGKSGGQNGFRLSLLGFEPEEDYEYLVKEGRGRRLFPAAPDHSLLLLKAVNTIPHGGGERIAMDSPDYRVLRRWIAQGMPTGSDQDPKVTGVSVYPEHRIMPTDGKQQLLVMAHYSDGSRREVTQTAQYEANDKDLAESSESGLVATLGRPGDVAVMVRYQGHVAVFGATVPMGIPVTNLPPSRGFIDDRVFEKLKDLGMPPSPIADDLVFLRRITLDLTGRLPTVAEARAFLASQDADKRDKAIDRLLDSDDYAEYFANKWASILRNQRPKPDYQRANYGFHAWIRKSLSENKPYDRFVTEILTASGEVSYNPPVAWFRQVKSTDEQVEDIAQLFLGVRIQCARCHHHPFEKWSQDDYYGLAAFFSRLGTKPGDAPSDVRVFHRSGTATAKHPRSGKDIRPAGLGADPLELAPEQDPRVSLAAWMSQPENPFFARSLVNRYWKHFFGRGIVDPEDDMRLTNPPSNPALLDALAKHFVGSGYDLKDLVRTITRSSAYQLSSLPNDYNATDKQAFSRYYPRRMNAEVLLDAIDAVNDTSTDFNGMPRGARAVQIPDHGGVDSYFLTVFGRPAGASACECERSIDASLAQSLHLLNSQDIHRKLGSGVARKLADAKEVEDVKKVVDLYYRAMSRPPSAEESKIAVDHLSKALDANQKRVAYEDLVWALINTKEFLFNH